MKHLSHWAEAETLKIKFKLKIRWLGCSSVLGGGLKRAAQLRLAAAEFVFADEAVLTGKDADSDGSGGPRPKRLRFGLAIIRRWQNGGGEVRLKRLFGNEVLYFQHSPPYTSLDTVSASKRLSPPFTDAPDYMCSPYFYWWAFMREWDDYTQCCADGGKGALSHLYDDFGDLRGLADDDFMDWWKQGGRMLFCEPRDQGVAFLPSAPRDHDYETHALISVPLDGDMDRVIAEIRSRLGKEMRARQGPDRDVSRAKYKVVGSPRLSALDKMLRIYRFRASYAEMTKVAIAYEVGILKDTDTSFNPESVTAQVSGYYKDACRAVANLVTGRFPDYSEVPEEPSLFE